MACGLQCVPVYLDDETAEGYYNGFSNNVLWPLLHYIPLSMLDSQGDEAERQWAQYQTANKVRYIYIYIYIYIYTNVYIYTEKNQKGQLRLWVDYQKGRLRYVSYLCVETQ